MFASKRGGGETSMRETPIASSCSSPAPEPKFTDKPSDDESAEEWGLCEGGESGEAEGGSRGEVAPSRSPPPPNPGDCGAKPGDTRRALLVPPPPKIGRTKEVKPPSPLPSLLTTPAAA